MKEIPATDTQAKRTQNEDDLTGDDLKQYEADIEGMNLILIPIPNDIYNYVDACENPREWYKYVTNVRLAKNLKEDTYDMLFDYLQQNVGNGVRFARRSSNTQGKSVESDNVQKETGNGNYFMEQMLLAKTDEAGVILSNKQNDFLLAYASKMEELEELSENICMMARIEKVDNDYEDGPSYDSAFIIECTLSLDKLAIPPHLHRKFCMGIAIATGCRGYYKPGTRAWDISDSDSDLESTARSGPRDSEMEDTGGSRIRINA
ncbi:hypothetical protein Tco_1073422 [Tanacetum coccineum]